MAVESLHGRYQPLPSLSCLQRKPGPKEHYPLLQGGSGGWGVAHQRVPPSLKLQPSTGQLCLGWSCCFLRPRRGVSGPQLPTCSSILPNPPQLTSPAPRETQPGSPLSGRCWVQLAQGGPALFVSPRTSISPSASHPEAGPGFSLPPPQPGVPGLPALVLHLLSLQGLRLERAEILLTHLCAPRPCTAWHTVGSSVSSGRPSRAAGQASMDYWGVALVHSTTSRLRIW